MGKLTIHQSVGVEKDINGEHFDCVCMMVNLEKKFKKQKKNLLIHFMTMKCCATMEICVIILEIN